jgi:hypothetical protein
MPRNWRIVLAADHDVDIVLAAQAMVHYRQEAVGVGREVDPDNFRLLVDDMVDKPGVLVREAIVVLAPHVGGQQIVQRGDLAPPRHFRARFEPLGVLGEHRVDDPDERLVGVEQPVPSGQQVSFEPAHALVLAEHRVQDAFLGREEQCSCTRAVWKTSHQLLWQTVLIGFLIGDRRPWSK